MKGENIKSTTPEEIVRMLEEPTTDRRPLKAKLQRQASVKQLVRALQISKVELTRRILCDILGARKAKTAVPALVECLSDPSPNLKDDAAEAIGKIGSPKAGEPLLRYFIHDPRPWFAVALGAIGYRPAIPSLINALSSPSPRIRGGAAWSLGEMHVLEANSQLEKAMKGEEDTYAYERMKEALEHIKPEEDDAKK